MSRSADARETNPSLGPVSSCREGQYDRGTSFLCRGTPPPRFSVVVLATTLSRSDVGHAFVNFVRLEFITNFVERRVGKEWNMYGSLKKCEVSYVTIQGIDCPSAKFCDSVTVDGRYREQAPVPCRLPVGSFLLTVFSTLSLLQDDCAWILVSSFFDFSISSCTTVTNRYQEQTAFYAAIMPPKKGKCEATDSHSDSDHESPVAEIEDRPQLTLRINKGPVSKAKNAAPVRAPVGAYQMPQDPIYSMIGSSRLPMLDTSST